MVPSDRHRSQYLWLGLIMLLALSLRIVGLNSPLWYDEILTVERHLRLPWAQMLDGYSMNNHYLFNLQSKLSIGIFGEQNWAVRLPAMLFGLGSIGVIWWLARDVADAAAANVTALLLALSYHHIWFSQNARGYSELAFFSGLGMILFLRGLERPTLKLWIAYGITLALAVFTHLTGAFLFVAQGLVWVFLVGRSLMPGRGKPGLIGLPLLGYLLGAALTLALYAPLLPSLINAVTEVSGTSTVDVMQEYQNPFWSLLEGVRTALGSTGILVTLVAGLVIILALVGGHATRHTAPLFAPLTWIHIGLTLGLLVLLGMRIWPRFFFADIGFVLLLIVLGVRVVTGWFDRLTGKAIPHSFTIATLAMILVSSTLAARNYSAPKQNLAGAYNYVQANRAANQKVYTVGQANRVFNGYFDAGWGEIVNDADYIPVRTQSEDQIFVVAFPARSFRIAPTLDADIGVRLQVLKRFPGTLGDGAVLILGTSHD